MSGDSSGQNRRDWGRYLFFVGLVLLSLLGWYFGWGNLAVLIGDASLSQLSSMALLIAAGFWVRAWKWHYVLGRGEQGVRLFFLAKTAGSFTPGRAGELAPLLLKRHRNARVAAWIGLDRVVEVSWTRGLGLLGGASIGLITWRRIGVGVVLAALCVACGCYLLLWQGRFQFSQGEEKALPSGLRIRLGHFMGRLRQELTLFAVKMPLIMITTALAKVTDIFAVILLCRAFGYEASFLLVAAARCAHALVSAVPVTPDATGIPFIAAAWCLKTYAAIPYDTLTAALGLEVIVINTILWACFFGISAMCWKQDAVVRPGD